MSTKKTSVRAGAGSSLKTGYAAPTAAASNRSISTTRSRASDTNSAVSSASNSNTRNSGKRLNGFPPPTTASAPVPPPPPSASLADLAESEKLKINRLVEKLFEITAKYEETQNLLKSERDQHQLEINQVYEKINGQLLIIEDKMKLKDETIQSLTSKEAALTSLTVIYQRKLKALLDHDLPDYQQQVQSLKSTIDILQAEQSSLQNISKNDKQLINRLEKEIIDKNQQLSDYQHHQIPLLEESLKQEKLKNHKQDEKLQELNMKNRFYHTEIKQLQVKIQQLNDAIYHQEMSGTPPRPNNSNSRHHTAHQTSSNGRRSERRYDNNEDDSDNMMSPPNYRTSSSRKDDNRSSSDHRHQRSSRATSSSRSRSPSPITPNPPTKTKASPAIKKDLKKGSEDYSLMFQSVNSDDLEHYVRTKHLKDEEEDEEDDDDREERGGKGSNGNGKVNFDAIFDTSDPYIEQPVNQKRDLEDDDDEEDGGYDEDIKPYQGKDSLRKGNEISKSLDSADWRKRSSREEEGKRSSRSDGTIVSHLPFRKSRSADSSPDNRPRPSLVNGERKRRTSDIFFGNDNDDGDDSFTFTANKRAHTMSSSGGIAGIAVLDDDPIVNGTNNGSDKKREKDSLNDTSLFFDNSLNLSTSNISSLHVSPVTPATALKEEQKRRLKESPDVEDEDDEEDDVGAKYYRLTKSAEKAKREEEKRKEEEVVSAFEEQRERARKSRLEREFLAAREKLNKRVPSIIKTEDIVQLKKEVEANNNNNSNNRDDDDNDDDDSIKKRIAVLSPIDSFNKTFTSAFTSSQRNGLEKKMSEKEIKNDEIDEDQPVSTTAGSKKYSLLSSYKSDEGKELQKKLSKRNVSSDERRVRASQDEVEEEDTELQGILDSSISNKKKKKKILKSSSEIGVEDVILNEKPKKSDSMMKKKTSFHSLDSEVLPYEMIMGEKEVKEKKSKIKSLKSTDSHDTNKVATTTKSGKKSSKLKSKTEDTAETNITAKTSASKKKTSSSEATPVISNTATNPSVTITATPNPTKTKKSSTNKKSPKTDSIYNASLFDLLEEM